MTGASDVYLHIGRGKAGSSTVQGLADTHGAYMQSVGVFCPLTVHGLSNNARLVTALEQPESDRPSVKKFRQDLARSPSPRMLVSAEAFHSISADGLARLQRLLGERRVHVLFYVRDYPGWLPSKYAQGTKKARNLDDFDRFLERTRGGNSVVARLEAWAAAFGWPNLRVRPLAPADLAGGELVSDLFAAMGLTAAPPPVSRRNESPHWITLEVMRALARRQPADRPLDNRSIKAIRRVVEEAVAGEPRSVRYLTRRQWQELAELYAADLEQLGRFTGERFVPALVPPADERPFLPSFDAVPRAVRDRIRAGLDVSRFRSRIDPEIAAALASLLEG